MKKKKLKAVAIKDGRIRWMGEILNNIKLIKIYTWEDCFEKKIKGKLSSCMLANRIMLCVYKHA